MLKLTKYKKLIITVVVAAATFLVLASFSLTVQSQTANNFALPLNINTTGNAWNGDLAFDLEISGGTAGTIGAENYLVVMDTNGNLLDLRQSSSGKLMAIPMGTLLTASCRRVKWR